jgi:cytochrome c oxidase subunit 3
VQQSDDTGGQQLFWVFYYIGTGMHGMHMLIGLGLIAWLLARARLGRYGATRYTAIEVVGLYWSFVDIVWLILYPLIYLAGGAA